MEMQGTRQLPVSREQAWDALNNPEVLKRCIPGCDKFELVGEHRYAVGVAIKIGPVSAKFSGTVTLQDIDPPNGYALVFDAQGGVAGFGKGESNVSLMPNDQGCELRYTVQSRIGGKLAQLGQRLVDGAAKSLAEDFFKRFEATFDAPAVTDADLAGSATGKGVASSAVEGQPVPIWAWGLATFVFTLAVIFIV
ncbi:carbon monoxide dehydrogenase [Limnohabitans sp. TS-CS-82]|uniref:CoxG family protein n=1 Tax=Limnohabitans sp. TS-CS-82 TaxID=2094193 RepID=UPI000CF21617|nr:carbon monoxide dehydrogenase subunit G [Limnohabitans sp. TS-CS-82]PQA83146.1 carbon monoxide dehydrogenase [Limnohabitans sp. TS-CS-82]